MNRFNNVIFGQKAFILNSRNEILIIKRKNAEIYEDYWDIPGGKLEEGDTLNNALAREIQEETGLQLKNVILVLTTSVFRGAAHDEPILFRNIYLCSASGKITLSKEHSDYKWVKPNEFPKYKFPEDTDFQAALKHIIKIVKKISLKTSLSLQIS